MSEEKVRYHDLIAISGMTLGSINMAWFGLWLLALRVGSLDLLVAAVAFSLFSAISFTFWQLMYHTMRVSRREVRK